MDAIPARVGTTHPEPAGYWLVSPPIMDEISETTSGVIGLLVVAKRFIAIFILGVRLCKRKGCLPAN
jgi:hypothetical protein